MSKLMFWIIVFILLVIFFLGLQQDYEPQPFN